MSFGETKGDIAWSKLRFDDDVVRVRSMALEAALETEYVTGI